MRDDDRAFFGKDRISGDMVEMIVGVDDKFYGKLGDHANFAEKSASGRFVFKSIDDGDCFIANHKAGVSTGFAFRIVDCSVDTVAEGFQSKREGGIGFGWRCLRGEHGNATEKKKQGNGRFY